MPKGGASIEIPYELRAPPPRPVRLRAERRAAMFWKIFFAALLDIPGVLFLLYVAIDPFVVRPIAPRPGIVIYRRISHGLSHNTTYHLGYSYILNGKRLTADESVNDHIYYSLKVGQTVQVRAVRYGPWHYVEMQNGTSLYDLVGVAALGLLWNAVVGACLFAWIMLPRRLIRIGQPGWGQVTGKRVETKNWISYRIDYQFQTPNRERRDSCMYVRRRLYEQAVVGADVVVLYDLKRDGSVQSLIYDFCDYVVG